jgi:hypothetical protein
LRCDDAFVEWIAAATVVACLIALAVLAARRWGAPHSYLGVRGTAWLAVIVMAVIVIVLTVH